MCIPFIGQQRHKKKARDSQATKKRYLRKCPEINARSMDYSDDHRDKKRTKFNRSN